MVSQYSTTYTSRPEQAQNTSVAMERVTMFLIFAAALQRAHSLASDASAYYLP